MKTKFSFLTRQKNWKQLSIWSRVFLAVVLFLMSHSATAATWQSHTWHGNAGYEYYAMRPHQGQRLQRVFAGFDLNLRGEVWQAYVATQARRDFAKDDVMVGVEAPKAERSPAQFRLPEAWINYQFGSHQWTLGRQILAWGETFGFPILDIVNIVDWQEPIIAGHERRKLASWLAQYQWQGERWHLQLLMGPAPSADEGEGPKFSRYWEGGGRLSYLSEDGWDWKGFAYRHQTRLPLYKSELTFDAAGLPTATVEEAKPMESSYGGSFSKDVDGIILRGDGIYSTQFHVQGPESPDVSARRAIILGMDRVFWEEWFFGVQWYQDAILRRTATTNRKQQDLWGLQMIYPYVQESYQWKAFAFQNTSNSDYWWQMEWLQSFATHWQLVLAMSQAELDQDIPGLANGKAFYARLQTDL